jgi:Raf kinase inhibitor-like YbhB/YbcL family protein
MSIGHAIARLAGKALSPIHAGNEKLATNEDATRAPETLRVDSRAFRDGAPIPSEYAGEAGLAPDLHWEGVPASAKEIVVLCEDPDAPMMKPFVHWSMYGIPATTHDIPRGATPEEGIPGGALQGKNSAGNDGFTGPKPPPGHGVHHYHFQVFALDAPLGLLPGADREDIVSAMTGHVLAMGETIGTYEVS